MVSNYGLIYKDGLRIDLHLPECDSFDLFVYFHGGGLCGGSHGGVEPFAETLAKRGIATATVEYRMYPSAHFPDFIVDGADAVRWLKDNISDYGKCHRIFVGGSSAGAYISMMLCFDGRYFERVGLMPTDIDGYIHDAGQPTAHFNVLKERGIDSRRVIIDDTAPLFHVGTSESYPPMQIIVSDNDIENRLEQTELLVGAIRSFGYDMKKVCYTKAHSTHVGYLKKVNASGSNEVAELILPFINGVI